jgi:hypothetical protein
MAAFVCIGFDVLRVGFVISRAAAILDLDTGRFHRLPRLPGDQ